MKKRLLTWLLMIVMTVSLIPSVSLAAASDKLELVSVKVKSDYQLELKFSEALNANTVDWLSGGIRMASTPSFTSSSGVTVVPSVNATVTYVHNALGYKEEAGIW